MSAEEHDFGHSVTEWLAGLKDGDEKSIEALWKRCFDDIVRLARRRFGDAPRRVHDEEDAAISVFESLCRGAAAGRFEKLQSRDDLWPLLVAMTRQKVVDRIRLQMRQKRGGGDVRGESVFGELVPGTPSPPGIGNVASDGLDPELLVDLEDQTSHALARLPDDISRGIALQRLEGATNEEIGQQLGISEASVRRKLRLIRDIWTQSIDQR